MDYRDLNLFINFYKSCFLIPTTKSISAVSQSGGLIIVVFATIYVIFKGRVFCRNAFHDSSSPKTQMIRQNSSKTMGRKS